MKTLLVKRDEKAELTGKTASLASGASVKAPQLQPLKGSKCAADPFFDVRSPRATEGNKVTVTLGYC